MDSLTSTHTHTTHPATRPAPPPSTHRHTKALDAFYDFMQAEGSPVRAELRDDNLTFFSRVLGGELHFMRCALFLFWAVCVRAADACFAQASLG